MTNIPNIPHTTPQRNKNRHLSPKIRIIEKKLFYFLVPVVILFTIPLGHPYSTVLTDKRHTVSILQHLVQFALPGSKFAAKFTNSLDFHMSIG